MQLFRYNYRYLTNRLFYKQISRQLSTNNDKPPYLMIASIGNPEPEYTFTRHNVGHFALDKLIEDHWTNFKSFTKHRNLSRGVYSVSNDSNMSNILLFKSNDTLMNLQGDPIFTNWRNVKRMQANNYSPALVILHDEIQLPLGKIQIRKQGTSARGHNGLRSIDSIMGKEYTKISIGVGKPPNKFVADYVLARFKRPEIETLTYDVMPQIVEVLEEMMKGKYIYEKSK